MFMKKAPSISLSEMICSINGIFFLYYILQRVRTKDMNSAHCLHPRKNVRGPKSCPDEFKMPRHIVFGEVAVIVQWKD